MIASSEGNQNDISHFMMVWAYARTIGYLEGLDERTQQILEIAALVHDIACPLCRVKYGNTSGKLQEQEGIPLARTFLEEFDLDEMSIDRICYLVGHHHTFADIDGPDYQILVEADYIVNALEKKWNPDNIRNFVSRYFKTVSEKEIVREVLSGACQEDDDLQGRI